MHTPELAITAVSAPGTEIDGTGPGGERFLDSRRIDGTLPEMLHDALSFCARNMKVRNATDPVTGMRPEQTEYPQRAVREAILNALIHRDCSENSEGTPVQVALFTDMLEVRSPGMLCGGLTEGDLGNAGAVIRNEWLASMAQDLMGMGKRNSGIRGIRREMAAAGLPPPLFRNLRDEFTVTLFNGTRGARHSQKK